MPLPNFFNSYFYGRSGKKDFTTADLPANRLQLFRDVLRVRRGSMIGVNFLYLLIWLPAVAWTFLNLLQLFSPPADAEGYLPRLAFSYLLVLCPLICITGPFNMGISRIMRNWARDEHSFILSDFASGMKENWKQGLIFSAISGLVPLVSCICVYFYWGMAETSPAFFLPLAIILLAAMLWSLSAPLLPTMIVTYRQGFFALMRNAVLMTLAQLPKAILIRLATLALPIIVILLALADVPFLSVAVALALVLYAVFMLSFNKLIQASWANALCEKYLNPKIQGARTDIGLRPKGEEE